MFRFLAAILAVLFTMPFLSTPASAAAQKGKILVVASSESTMAMPDGSSMNVGFFLNEFAVPAQYLAEKGYDIVLATPSGQRPVMDAGSNSKRFFHDDDKARSKALDFVNNLPVTSLKTVVQGNLDQYDALFVPGGHAPMTDLMQDRELGTILTYFHEHKKPTAFICHGPAAALAALPDAAGYRKVLVGRDAQAAMQAAKGWIYKGYRMTAFTDAEEWPGEVRKGVEMPFHVEQALQIAGGLMDLGPLNGSHVVHDRELITGQNPASDLALAKELDRTLSQK
jgi:putative intracellular protease/amidase